jgi:hypothetical protein
MKRLILNLGFIFICLVAFFSIRKLMEMEPTAQPFVDDLSSLQEHSLSVLEEMNKLLISLALLIVGAVGGLILNKKYSFTDYDLWTNLLLLLTVFFAVLSIYFGYILYYKLVEMLSNNMFDASSDSLTVPQRYQFFLFLLSVISISLFMLNNLLSGPKNKPDQL